MQVKFRLSQMLSTISLFLLLCPYPVWSDHIFLSTLLLLHTAVLHYFGEHPILLLSFEVFLHCNFLSVFTISASITYQVDKKILCRISLNLFVFWPYFSSFLSWSLMCKNLMPQSRTGTVVEGEVSLDVFICFFVFAVNLSILDRN